jgi:hypothetical protein
LVYQQLEDEMSLTDEQISKCAEPIYGYSLDPEDTQDRQFARAIESAATAPLLERIADLERQLEQVNKDSERYRWLKSRPTQCPTIGPDLAFWDDSCGNPIRGDDADAAIDAAIKESK